MTRFCTSCTKPTGTICLSSPRRARLRMPPRSRALSTCSSASLIVPFKAQQQAIVEVRGIIQPSLIEDECVGKRAQFEKPMPIRGVARQARHFQAEHDSDAPQTDFSDQALEAFSISRTGARLSQVTVDHDDAIERPAQRHCAPL